MTGLINPRLDQIQSMHDMNIESIRHFLMKILQHIEWREMSHKMLLEMQVIQSIGYNIHIQISYIYNEMSKSGSSSLAIDIFCGLSFFITRT